MFVFGRMYKRRWYSSLSSLKMATACRLLLIAWWSGQPPSSRAFAVTEFRPADCPAACLCGVGTSVSPLPVKGYFATVSCPNRKLAAFPTGLPSETRILVLRGNALRSTAPAGAGPGPGDRSAPLPPQLSELDLSYNLIDDVTMTSPAHLLHHLDLQHNAIAHLSASSFTELPRLQVIV